MTSITSSRPQKCASLDVDSVKAICKGSEQVMVYGWRHCKYLDVIRILREMSSKEGSPVKKVFDWNAGSTTLIGDDPRTLEGRKINLIAYQRSSETPQITSRPCKTGMTDLVLENVKRLREKRAPIPLIFCQDIDGNPHEFVPTDMISKNANFNNAYTHKELRRAYKLCTHENEEIRKAALQTFKFVRLKNVSNETYALQPIDAPWETPYFSEFWKVRKGLSTSKPKADNENWRKQLETLAKKTETVQAPEITFEFPVTTPLSSKGAEVAAITSSPSNPEDNSFAAVLASVMND